MVKGALMVGAVALGLCGFTVPVKERAHVSSTRLIANGMASASVTVEALSILGTRTWVKPQPSLDLAEGSDLVRLGPTWVEPGMWRRDLIAGTHAGRVDWSISSPLGASLTSSLELVPDRADSDDDGFPNALELVTHEDRTAFRRWFTDIAFAQHLSKDADWAIIHRDCAGLLRYAYKEALESHDDHWWAQRRRFRPSSSRDVSRFRYPNLPVVGAKLFRTGDGSEFGVSASARILRDDNARFLGHDRAAAEQGDLLFFEKRGESGHVFHAMIFLRELPHGLAEGRTTDGPYVVYHTGPEGVGVQTPDDSGEVRLVAMNELLQHPDPGWHPVRDNPDFSGFYRWRILE